MTTPREKSEKKHADGPAARAAELIAGVVDRVARPGELTATPSRGGVDLVQGDRVVARLVPRDGRVVADVDPRAEVGDKVVLRRLGSPHPDKALSAAGWRQLLVRTRADAARLVHALRPMRVKATGETRRRIEPLLIVGKVRVRRAMDPPHDDDGIRVFVDEAWPHGLDPRSIKHDHWIPEVAPGKVLRAAFGPVPGLRRGFRRAYLAELKGGAKATHVSRLRHMARSGTLTLLTGVREIDGTHAKVLADAVTHGRTPRS